MIEGFLFFSESIGHAKPSRGFFDACIKAAGAVKPEEIMMIGDALSADIEGAAACGLRTCWYTPMRLCSSADHVVQTLEEIKNIL